MNESILYVGLDTDKRSIDVAVAEPLPGGEVRYLGRFDNTPAMLDRLVRRLQKGERRLDVCYEAGPCGYGVYRRLNRRAGVSCAVVAPALIPRRPGDRVKTNRRDAVHLAKLHRAGELTAVWVPDGTHEAMRDLVRARAAAVADLVRCRQRIASFLLRQEIGWSGRVWSRKHRTWLGQLRFPEPAQAAMMGEALHALDEAEARRERLGEHIAELLGQWSLRWLVEALQVLRGFQMINAVTLVSEIGDPRRFTTPRQLMAFVGLVPSEHSTGDSIRRGRLTKAGNSRARKTLIEAAWTYARPATVRPSMAPPALQAIADKARHRLSRRYRRLVQRGKRAPIAVAAIARELLGFVWALAHAAAPAARCG